jgi:O-antigen/teichoic acid export membrane protein
VFKAGESGVINYLVNNLALLVLVTGLSLESATGYYSARNEIPQSNLIGVSLMMVVVCMITTSVALPVFFPDEIVTDRYLFLACILYTGGIVMSNYFTALFYSHFNYLVPNLITIIVNICVIVFTLLLSQRSIQPEPVLFLKVYFCSFFLMGAGLFLSYNLRYGHLKNLSLPTIAQFKKLSRYALLAFAANLIFFLVYRVDYWFVKVNCTNAELGNYIQVSKLAQLFMLLPAILAGLIFTKTIREDLVNQVTDLQLLSRGLMFLYLILILILVIGGYWIFPFIYGDSFRLMYLPFLLLSPGILSLSTLSLMTAFYAGQGNLIISIKGALVALIVIVAGNLIFSAMYGIYAAAAVSSIGYISYQVYAMNYFKSRHRHISIADFFLLKKPDFSRFKTLLVPHEKD